MIHLKLTALGGSFTAVFTGSYFCRTEGAVDVNLLLVRISFRVKGCTGRSAAPGQAADGTVPGSDPPDCAALLAPSSFLQQSPSELWRGTCLPSSLQPGGMSWEGSSSPWRLEIC